MSSQVEPSFPMAQAGLAPDKVYKLCGIPGEGEDREPYPLLTYKNGGV